MRHKREERCRSECTRDTNVHHWLPSLWTIQHFHCAAALASPGRRFNFGGGLEQPSERPGRPAALGGRGAILGHLSRQSNLSKVSPGFSLQSSEHPLAQVQWGLGPGPARSAIIYSITLSATASRAGGTSRPSALA